MRVPKEHAGARIGPLVLETLTRDATYGYRLIQMVNAEAEGALEWQEGVIYPVLHHLEREGFVQAQWQEAETGRRRRFYAVTDTGREVLADNAKDWTGFQRMFRSSMEKSQ